MSRYVGKPRGTVGAAFNPSLRDKPIHRKPSAHDETELWQRHTDTNWLGCLNANPIITKLCGRLSISSDPRPCVALPQVSIVASTWEVENGHNFLRLPVADGRYELTAKLEGFNPAGSIKLKTAIGLVDDAERRQGHDRGLHLIESTSGNLGVALATVCAARGHSLVLVTDPNATMMSRRHMAALGARVIVVDERDENGGYLGTRIQLIQELIRSNPEIIWLNQYANAANSLAHATRTVSEILTFYGTPDVILIGAGTTGTLMGCIQGFREAGISTRVIAVDAAGSVTFGDVEPAARFIPGIGTSRRPDLFVDDGTFEKIVVREIDAVRACREVARDSGVLFGGSTGSVLAGLSSISATIEDGARVLVIAPDQGEKYLDTIYDDEWVSTKYGSEFRFGKTR